MVFPPLGAQLPPFSSKINPYIADTYQKKTQLNVYGKKISM